ncbi:MAG: glycosyltransferase [Kofleriaceae bacterium]
MTILSHVALGLYAISIVLLSIYALHSLWLIVEFLRHRRVAARVAAAEVAMPLPAILPMVLVQLPVFNERDVVERMVAAAGMLRWPRARLRIQLLDDGTDDSVALGALAIAALSARGLDAVHLHRTDRIGYKAGALEYGLDADATHPAGAAEYVAIFDADFMPTPDFLERAIKPLLLDPGLALVQGRWEHHNRDANRLTRAQALGIDGHFAIEQGARSASGLALNFNGTCGLWRRTAIADAGGWQHDTLTEDMDLSYRAQLAGWRCTYRLDLAVPGEIPTTVSAWRTQQFRWAKGSIQTGRKLLGAVWRSSWSLRCKLAATAHMTHFLVHPLILTSLLVAPLAMPSLHQLPTWAVVCGAALFVIGVSAPIVLYVSAQFVLRGRAAWRRLRDLPVIAAIGTGVAASNSRAVWEALRAKPSEFVRTPKQGDKPASSYRAHRARGHVELACAAWAFFGAVLGARGPHTWMGSILALYGTGFLWVGLRLWRDGRSSAVRSGTPTSGPTRTRASHRLLALGLLGVLGHAVLGLWPGQWRDTPVVHATLGLGLAVVYVLAALEVRAGAQPRRALAWILGITLAMRLGGLGLAPSDDVARYIVEGEQVRAGENPYVVPPGASVVTAHLDPAINRALNHREWTAIYPPGTLALEAATTAITPHPLAFKLLALIAELVGLLVVAWLLVRDGRSVSWLVLAAWHPAAVIFGAGEAHHDMVLATLLLAALALAISRPRVAVAVATIAALIKPFGVLVLPALLRTRDPVRWLLPPALLLLAYLPFADAGPALFASLGRFGTELHFHGVLEPLLRGVISSLTTEDAVHPTVVATLAVLWLGGSLALWGLGTRERWDAVRLTARLYVWLLICAPTLHPWYLLPLVMLLPLVRSPALLVWMACAPIYWLHGLDLDTETAWAEVGWVTTLAHAPAAFVLAWTSLSARRAPLLDLGEREGGQPG